MSLIKKIWMVSDYQGGDPSSMWTDPAFQDDEHRLGYYCGALQEGGYSADQLFRVIHGTEISQFFRENPVLHDSADSARKDAEKRFARDKKKYGPKTASDLASRVASRFKP